MDRDDYCRAMPSPSAEMEVAGTFTAKHGFRGCAPNFFAKLRLLDFYGGLDPTRRLEGDTFDEMSATGRETQHDGAPVALMEPRPPNL